MRFTGTLDQIGEKRNESPSNSAMATVTFPKSYQLSSFRLSFPQKKERGKLFVFAFAYGRFFIIAASKTPTAAIATIIATPTPMMYISVGGKVTTG